eukprot:CAMPEP_0117628086 /NCGR_PEP_ID=MMETSP0802-20121206/2278_1 /TAXON_ID=38833 /ORGANISM="Micromonas sp., Strain CCMP2099" /LENGTH=344 /DNA_ID=CAMNT_0005432273 /DNA_START=134 /DNA_END=1165 /DNA_ORIENTATION=+
MADKGNHVLVAVLSALAGAKLQDICVAMLSRRRERKNGQGGGAGPRVVKQTPTSTPTRTPTKPKPSDGVIPDTGTPVRVAASSRIDSKKEHVVCPTCDSPDAYATGKHVVSLHNTATEKRPDPYDPAGREMYLSWDDYFMSVAFLSAQRSKDPNKQVGAVIVSPSKIIRGVGYNGFPRGCVDESLPWAKKDKENNPMRTKYPYVCHAEMNAIMNKNSENLVGASLFVTMYPCVECAKLILQSGITEVVYFEGKEVFGEEGDDVSGGVVGSVNDAESTNKKTSEPPSTPAPATAADFEETQSPITPTRNGVRPNPTYAAAGKLLRLANVAIRQHTPSASVDVTYW